MKRLIIFSAICLSALSASAATDGYESRRPAPQERLFVSQAVESRIEEVAALLTNDKLRWMFVNCFPNTLDTTVHPAGEYDTFVYTGDIHAMWLRDSSAQVMQYLFFAKECEMEKQIII